MTVISLKTMNRIGITIVVVISLSCGYGVLSHIHRTKKQFRIEKAVLSEKLKEVNLAETNLGDLKTVLQNANKELAYLNERVPEPGKIGLLLQQIDALLQQHHIKMISIQPLAVVEENMYMANPIRLIFEGRFEDIFRLLCDIEKMNRMVVMDRISIVRQAPSKSCRVEMLTTVFERKKPGIVTFNG